MLLNNVSPTNSVTDASRRSEVAKFAQRNNETKETFLANAETIRSFVNNIALASSANTIFYKNANSMKKKSDE